MRSFSIIVSVCAALLMLACAARVQAQTVPPIDSASAGYTYIVAFPGTVSNLEDPRFPDTRVGPEMALWLYSAVDMNALVTLWGNPNRRDTIMLTAGEMYRYVIPEDMRIRENGVVKRATYIVETGRPVLVYCYYADEQGAEAWAPAPLELWGMEHHVACLPGATVQDMKMNGGPVGAPKAAPGTILLIGGYRETEVKVIPPPGVRLLGLPDPSSTITLRFGEVCQLQSVVDTSAVGGLSSQPDVAATRIYSDQPIGVMCGNTRSGGAAEGTAITNNAFRNLMIEWVPPVNQYGTHFVYLPTWDGRQPGSGDPFARRRELVRMYNFAGSAVAGVTGPGNTQFTMPPGSFADLSFDAPEAVELETAQPAMAMMYSAAAVRRTDTPEVSGDTYRKYDGYAPYMTGITPRHQWTTFAPLYAPENPAGMEHFVSVVTDSATALNLVRRDGLQFPFTRAVRGTNLVWGTLRLTPGETDWLYAKNGGRFGGVVFGVLKGEESYRMTGSGDEYREHSALSYGYPLAAHRTSSENNGLTLVTDTTGSSCDYKNVTLELIGLNPASIASIELDPATAVNAKLEYFWVKLSSKPDDRRRARYTVTTIDRAKDASATVVIRSSDGQEWRHEYSTRNSYIEFNEVPSVHFGTIPRYGTRRDTVHVTNTRPYPIRISMLSLLRGNEGFLVSNSDDPAPWTLQPGETRGFSIFFRANRPGSSHVDTLYAHAECYGAAIALTANIEEPAGVLDAGEGAALALRALRDERGPYLRFTMPDAGHARLELFNSEGRQIGLLLDEVLSEGDHRVVLNTRGMPAGVYFARLSAAGTMSTVPCVVVR